jgi:hypothetical protein
VVEGRIINLSEPSIVTKRGCPDTTDDARRKTSHDRIDALMLTHSVGSPTPEGSLRHSPLQSSCSTFRTMSRVFPIEESYDAIGIELSGRQV